MASANPATIPDASAVGWSADRVHGARRADRDRHVARAQPDTEGGSHVVAGPRSDDRAAATRRRSRRARARRAPTATSRRSGVDDRQQVVAVLTARRRTSSRCPDASPRSVTNSPVRRNVSQSCGRHDARQPLPRVRFGAMQPRQLGDREAATGTLPHASAHAFRAARQLLDQPRRVGRRLGVVPQLRRPYDLVRARRARPSRAAARRH